MDKNKIYSLNQKCNFAIDYVNASLRFAYEIKEIKKKYPNFQLPSCINSQFFEKTMNLIDPIYAAALTTNRFFRSYTSVITSSISVFDHMADENIDVMREARDIIIRVQEGLNSPQ